MVADTSTMVALVADTFVKTKQLELPELLVTTMEHVAVAMGSEVMIKMGSP